MVEIISRLLARRFTQAFYILNRGTAGVFLTFDICTVTIIVNLTLVIGL